MLRALSIVGDVFGWSLELSVGAEHFFVKFLFDECGSPRGFLGAQIIYIVVSIYIDYIKGVILYVKVWVGEQGVQLLVVNFVAIAPYNKCLFAFAGLTRYGADADCGVGYFGNIQSDKVVECLY